MGIEASAAQDAVTAIIKAFGKNVTDIEDVMDKLVLVGNNFPISVSQLAEGMNNAGSMLAVAGNSFEQSIALLTAANTTIQNISKASTGLRTIAARIRRTTTGEGDDGEIVEEAKYQEMVNALTKRHVSLVDEVTGQYRSTYDIIRDIAGVWKDMTSMEQAAVVEALAGTRQQNIFASLMTQFGEAEDAMERMNNSAGELQESYDIYLGSIQAHVQTLKAAFDELSRDFVNSGFAKGAVDILTKIIEALDWIITHKLEFAAAAGTFTVLATGIKTLGVGIAAGGITSLRDFAAALSLATGAGTGFLAAAAPLTVVVGALSAALLLYKKYCLDAVPSTNQLEKEFKDAKNEATTLEKQIDVNNKRLKELSEIKATGGWTEQLEAERAGLEEQNQTLIEQLALLQDIARYKQEAYAEKVNRDLDFFFATGRTTQKSDNTFLGSHDVRSETGYGGLLNTIDDYEAAVDRLEELEERRANHDWENQSQATILNSDISQTKNDIAAYAESIAQFQADLIAQRNVLAEIADENSIKNIARINEALELIAKTTKQDGKSFDDFKTKIKSLSRDAIRYLKGDTENAEKAMKDLQTWMLKSGYTAEEIQKYFKDYLEELNTPPEESNVIDTQISKWGTMIDEIARAKAALEDYNKALEGGNNGDVAGSMQDAWQKAMEEIDAGRIDSRAAWALYEMVFSPEQIDAMGRDAHKLAQAIQSEFFKGIFDDNNTENGYDDADNPYGYGQRLLQEIEKNLATLEGVDVWRDDSGLHYWIDDFAALAEQMGISEAFLDALLDDLDSYGSQLLTDTVQNTKMIQSLEELTAKAGDARQGLQDFVKAAYRDNPTLKEDDTTILRILDSLHDQGVLTIDPTEYRSIVEEAKAAIDAEASNQDPAKVSMVPDEDFLNADTDRVLQNLQSYLNDHPLTVTYVGNYTNAQPPQDTSNGTNNGNNQGTTTGGTPPRNAANIRAFGAAEGKTAYKNGGKTLVNEVGPELISDNGRAFIANGGRPGFVNLSKDAIVFNAEETDEILRRSRINGSTAAFAKGTRGSTRGGLVGRLLSGVRYAAKRYAMGTTRDDSPVVTKTTESVKRCPRCGSSVAYSYSVCPYCGYNFAGGGFTTSGTRTTTTNNNTGQTRTVTQYNSYDTNPNTDYNNYGGTPDQHVPQPTTWGCPRCGAVNSISVSRCKNCGYPGTDTRRVIQDSSEAQRNTASSGGFGGTGGGNHIGGADYASASDPQKVDWVAVRINRLQRTIADLEKVASSGFKKLDKRLSATKEQIKKTSEEISDMDRAYYRYMAEADSVGLSSDLVHKVREGTIDISEYDDETRKQIDEYTEWYEKALDAKSAIEELHQDIAQLYVDSFDAVQTDFENQLAQIEHSANMTSKHLEMAQTKGYLDSANFYEQLASDQSKTVTKLGAELDELNAKMQEAMKSGEIDEGSEAWYQMKASINEVEEALADANIQLVKYQRTIRQLDWTYFDYAQERMSQLNADTQFFIDLMAHHDLFSDNGQFNNLGEATAGLHAVNYDVYMEQAEAYAEQIRKIQKDLESDPYDTELIKRREQLLDLQRQSISSAEGEKEALKSLVQEGINKELEALKDLIDTYKDSLDSAKDLYEYQKKVTEQTSDIASLQKQLAAYQGDTSEENRARVQKLQNDLRKAQTDLRETEWDQNISDQKKLLDDLYDEYEDLLNTRLDNIDLLMQEMIAGTNANMDSIRNTLIEVGDEVGYSMTDQLTQALSNDLSYYDHVFEGINSVHLVLTNIYDMVSAMARASGAVKAYATGGLVDYTGLAAVHGTKARPELMLNANDTVNFLEAAKLMRDTFTGTKLSGLPDARESGSGVGIGQLVVNIPIERVQDYNDFVRQLQNDPKFDRLISAMTLDRTLGKSAFGKNRIMF